ncbi:hypothetical protein [Lacicoccus qingdaonensis]|uniref:Uncharacterized protein n=1 Tax=Lacicoccus qingdaonensis TaxID=576118 RepID=A0A1G9J4R9_9BACL|nr:hypothetical protein [Salinicoccus qingdaonensis]SDL32154.1 hypothetical protein SAMN05216216_1427 [Salinicoccus qingdaonensis]
MFTQIIRLLLVSSVLVMSACQAESVNENLINKVNSIEDSWINYEGAEENNNTMVRSQFIPYDPDKAYEVNYPTYIAYYDGEKFLETIRHQDTPATVETVEEADGVIVSFNKKNKNGMQMVVTDEQ